MCAADYVVVLIKNLWHFIYHQNLYLRFRSEKQKHSPTNFHLLHSLKKYEKILMKTCVMSREPWT
jgi:hypothetical protein